MKPTRLFFSVMSLFSTMFLTALTFSYAQENTQSLAVRGTVGERVVYQFVGTEADIAFQCAGGFSLLQFTDPILENDAIPHWTANGRDFQPTAAVTHDVVCQSILENAEANRMAEPDARFMIKGVMDETFAYEFVGTFEELLEQATVWLAENQIEFAILMTVETWDNRTITYETLLPWSAESLPHIMRGFSIFLEPQTRITPFELY